MNQDVRICFIGDSFVNGTGDPDCLGWTGRLCAAACRAGHSLTYYNLGIRRDTSADLKARWRQELIRRLPLEMDGRVVFSFGANDTTLQQGQRRVSLADSLQNARDMLQEASDRVPVLMVGPAPIADDECQNQRIQDLSHGFAGVCQSLGIPYLEVFASLRASKTWMQEAMANDGAHPRAGGYAELACLVQDWPAWQRWLC